MPVVSNHRYPALVVRPCDAVPEKLKRFPGALCTAHEFYVLPLVASKELFKSVVTDSKSRRYYYPFALHTGQYFGQPTVQ